MTGRVIALAALVAASLAFAAPDGELNLLNNPGFAKDASGFPADWCFKRRATKPVDVSGGGEVALHAPSNGASFTQGEVHLVPGRKYAFGADVQTAGLSGNAARLVVYNYAWTKDASLWLPLDTAGEWKRVEMEFEAPPSRDELYSFALYFKGGGKGDVRMRAPFLVPASGRIDGEERAPRFAFGDAGAARRPAVPERRASGTRLNNLVRRLLSAGRSAGVHRFRMEAPGWIWIASGGGEAASFTLDGRPIGSTTVDGRAEAMCKAGAGEHSLLVRGGGDVVVNAMATVMCTSYPDAKRNPRMEGEFAARYLLPTFNTFSYGWDPKRIAAGDRAELKRLGREVFGHLCRWHANTPGFDGRMESSGHLAERLLASNGMTHPLLSGLTFDEISASADLEKRRFTGALRLCADAPRPLWVWSSGVVYETNEVNADYLSAVAAASGGRGRLLFECYAVTPPDEAAAKTYLDDFLDESIHRVERMVPGFRRASMIVNGGYTKIGGYYTDCWPGADVKRFWDLYFHRLATSPAFDGLAGVGMYAIGCAEEEDLRWACRLLRHYAVEGRTNLLSDEYGYKYNPGLVGDCGGERRFRRSEKGPNRLSQKISGLEPGRLYSVRVAVSDAKEQASGKWNQRRLAFGVEVAGAEDVTASSPLARWGEPVRVDKKLNERTVVFRAKSREAELVLSDWEGPDGPGGPIGEELVVKAIKVKPYFSL